jgi:TPR repeat protein
VALNALGTMYTRGAAGLPVDHVKAMEYFKRAANLKYPDAQVNMGLIYLSNSKPGVLSSCETLVFVPC